MSRENSTVFIQIGKRLCKFALRGTTNGARALTTIDNDAAPKNGNAPRIIGVRRDGAIVHQNPKDSDRSERGKQK